MFSPPNPHSLPVFQFYARFSFTSSVFAFCVCARLPFKLPSYFFTDYLNNLSPPTSPVPQVICHHISLLQVPVTSQPMHSARTLAVLESRGSCLCRSSTYTAEGLSDASCHSKDFLFPVLPSAMEETPSQHESWLVINGHSSSTALPSVWHHLHSGLPTYRSTWFSMNLSVHSQSGISVTSISQFP